MKMAFSLWVSLAIISCVITCVIGIFFLRQNLQSNPSVNQNPFITNTIPGLLNSIQIFIFNSIYNIVGNALNNFENHKILPSYENSLIAKTFIFMFFNTFNTFFSIAFLSSYFSSLGLCDIQQGTETISNCFQSLSS